MKGIKLILIITFFAFLYNGYSQSVKRYESDFALKVTASINESPDEGTFEDMMKENITIIHDTSNATVEVILSDHNVTAQFFTDVKYNQTFTNNGNRYVAYTAQKDGTPYFISFGKEIIKIDNRVTRKVVGFHLKKQLKTIILE